MADWINQLRREINLKAMMYAQKNDLPFYMSKGGTVLFEEYTDKRGFCLHGNFLPETYFTVGKKPVWAKLLRKQYQYRNSLPLFRQGGARQVDSSSSTEALLINVLCHPAMHQNRELLDILGVEAYVPSFAAKCGLKRKAGSDHAFEAHAILSNELIIEAALSETNFCERPKAYIESIEGFFDAFDDFALPQSKFSYMNSRLIQAILYARLKGMGFVLLLDARRPDLLDAFRKVQASIKDQDVKGRIHVFTWQSIVDTLPEDLSAFLMEKYGIVSNNTIAMCQSM